MGKNGVTVQGTLYTPADGQPATGIPLHSQDYIQIGDKAFYFLLPRSQARRASRRLAILCRCRTTLTWLCPDHKLVPLQASACSGRAGSKATAVCRCSFHLFCCCFWGQCRRCAGPLKMRAALTCSCCDSTNGVAESQSHVQPAAPGVSRPAPTVRPADAAPLAPAPAAPAVAAAVAADAAPGTADAANGQLEAEVEDDMGPDDYDEY